MTKLLDQSCKDIRKTQSDGWSSEEDDDNVFDATGRETTSPQTGVFSAAPFLMFLREICVCAEPYKQPLSFSFALVFPQAHPLCQRRNWPV